MALASSPRRFLDLPAEIRGLVYTHFFAGSEIFLWGEAFNLKPTFFPEILSTCRAIYNEALALLYRSTTIDDTYIIIHSKHLLVHKHWHLIGHFRVINCLSDKTVLETLPNLQSLTLRLYHFTDVAVDWVPSGQMIEVEEESIKPGEDLLVRKVVERMRSGDNWDELIADPSRSFRIIVEVHGKCLHRRRGFYMLLADSMVCFDVGLDAYRVINRPIIDGKPARLVITTREKQSDALNATTT